MIRQLQKNNVQKSDRKEILDEIGKNHLKIVDCFHNFKANKITVEEYYIESTALFDKKRGLHANLSLTYDEPRSQLWMD